MAAQAAARIEDRRAAPRARPPRRSLRPAVPDVDGLGIRARPPSLEQGQVNVSVVIRAKDEADSIGHTLDLLQRQTVECELIVVDSGSTDGTPDIARERGAKLIEISAAGFTFGGSLNTGTEAA